MNPRQAVGGMKDIFSYVVTFDPSTVVGVTTNATLNVLSDMNFVWTHGYAHIVVTASGVPALANFGTNTCPVPTYPFLLNIVDQRSQRNMMAAPVPLDTLFRNPSFGGPRELPFPRKLLANSVLRFDLTRQFAGQIDATPATVTNSLTVRLTLEGYREPLAA